MLILLFERCTKRRGIKENDPFDWEKQEHAVASTINSCNMPSNMPSKPDAFGQNNVTQMTVAGSNASGMEYVRRKVAIIDPVTGADVLDTLQMATTEPVNQHREKVSYTYNILFSHTCIIGQKSKNFTQK